MDSLNNLEDKFDMRILLAPLFKTTFPILLMEAPLLKIVMLLISEGVLIILLSDCEKKSTIEKLKNIKLASNNIFFIFIFYKLNPKLMPKFNNY
jgi:hypothetical protein